MFLILRWQIFVKMSITVLMSYDAHHAFLAKNVETHKNAISLINSRIVRTVLLALISSGNNIISTTNQRPQKNLKRLSHYSNQVLSFGEKRKQLLRRYDQIQSVQKANLSVRKPALVITSKIVATVWIALMVSTVRIFVILSALWMLKIVPGHIHWVGRTVNSVHILA